MRSKCPKEVRYLLCIQLHRKLAHFEARPNFLRWHQVAGKMVPPAHRHCHLHREASLLAHTCETITHTAGSLQVWPRKEVSKIYLLWNI